MEGRSIVYWILWNLGTSGEDDHEDLSTYKIFDVRDLVDGFIDPYLIAGRLLMIIDEIKKNQSKIVVKCQAGISRSNALVMGILCINNNMEWDDAHRIVKILVPRAAPNEGIINATKQAISAIKMC